jgi:ABC-2 type transport system permease protein
MILSIRRVAGLCLRHLYILRGSWLRLLEMAYWPLINVVMWGFTSQFLSNNSSWFAQAGGVLIAGALLWDVMFRGNLGVALSFLEEMWSRNLGYLSVSPLRPGEMVAAILVMSFIRTMIGVLPAALLAIPLYHFSLFSLGLPLLVFWTLLTMMGWATGLAVSAMVLRFGLGAESLAWVMIFAIGPLAGVYYPISVLPGWLQSVAWALPPAHVFEGMRAVMTQGIVRTDLMLSALALDLVYLTLGIGLFLYAWHGARVRSALLNVGE